jgi:hypothetical protein
MGCQVSLQGMLTENPMEIWWKGVDLMHLAQDRDQRWALNTVMNLWIL